MISFRVIFSIIWVWIIKEWTMGICKIKKRLDGKIVVITGASCGIGFETALDFAKRGATLILANRNSIKGKQAVKKIRKVSGNEKIYNKSLDLSSQKDTKRFANEITKEYPKIHYLINNAGRGGNFRDSKPTISEDGFELTMATNYLGHVTLIELILPCLKAAAQDSEEPSRIVNVSSIGHMRSKIDVNNLDFSCKNNCQYSSQMQYFDSKLAQILYSNELARIIENENIQTVSLHPGCVRTSFFRDFNSIDNILFVLLFYWIGKNSWQGAQTTIEAVLTSKNINGEYWQDCGKTKIYSRRLIGDSVSESKFFHATRKVLNLSPNIQLNPTI